jgi:ectoine hydroxylase-related dioxygenase (phytanoyl-CoA dioxygenase family)
MAVAIVGSEDEAPGIRVVPPTILKDEPMTTPVSAGPGTGWFSAGWFGEQDCRLDDFRALVEQRTDPADFPLADAVEQNVLVYGEALVRHLASPQGRREAQTELARALMDGPGIVVLAGAYPDLSVIDRAGAAFESMIAEQKAASVSSGDHFAKPGANERIWGALDKLALRAPDVFADYYANDALALVSEAWLGANYQVTSQVNVVNPGGAAQVAHRDYHLGFMSDHTAQQYPAHVHRLSPGLTLQGAVAHCDMPVETGPTMYLPHSQKYPPGFVAFHQPEFTGYFDTHFIQLPLRKGDVVFFNPALFHGAGTNRSATVRRMANLLQVSSAFGRAMETVDRAAMCRALYPVLLARQSAGASEQALHNVVAASAEGYAFPTNLDHDQPIDGLTPPTQADLVRRALRETWDAATLEAEIAAQRRRRDPSAAGPLPG